MAELVTALEQKQEVVSALQAENAGWSAKLMAHREWHDGEVENVRRALKQESEGKVRRAGLQGGVCSERCWSVPEHDNEMKQAGIIVPYVLSGD